MWTEKDMKLATTLNNSSYRDYFKRLMDFNEDLDIFIRHNQHTCKYCWYLKTNMSWQAFTDYKCSNCEKTFKHHNSATPKLCSKCANELNVCQYCGQQMD